jgi:hypothetical protein
MKKILLLSSFFIFNSFASTIEAPIKNGEVKILYPCAVADSLPKEKPQKLTISFFEKGKSALGDKGLIFRYRDSVEEDDITLKFRPKNGSKIMLDEALYSQLKSSRLGELKCEADVTYDPVKPVIIPTCGFKSEGKELTKDHFEFLEMVDLQDLDLSHLRKVEVKATKWKLKIEDLNNAASFSKPPALEMWRFGNECIFEVSAKFDDLKSATIIMKQLKKLIRHEPSPVQGNKTSRVLQQI